MFFVNITKAYLGGGVVLLPEAIMFGGFILGPCLILVLAFLLNHTMKLLIRMKEAVSLLRQLEPAEEEAHLLMADAEGVSEDEDRAPPAEKIGLGSIGEFCFGWIGRLLVNCALLATNVGIVISYVNLNTQSFQSVIFGSNHSEQTNEQNYQIVLWVQFVGVCFLCLLGPKQLSFSSLLGNAAVAFAMSVVIVNSIQFMYNPSRAPVQPGSNIFAPIGDKVVAAVPNIFFSFVMHGTILSQHEAINHSDRQHAPRQLNLAALVVRLGYAVFATMAYVAYAGMLTSPEYKVGTSILMVLVPQSGVVSATTSILSFAILLSIPLFTDGVFDLVGLAWRAPQTSSSSWREASRGGVSGSGNVAIGLFRIVVVLAMFAVLSIVRLLAAGGSEEGQQQADPLSYPLKITGAVAMSWLGCIIPALFYMSFAVRGVPTFKIVSLDGGLVMAAGLVGIVSSVLGVKN